mgnify:CR=1 FL=1
MSRDGVNWGLFQFCGDKGRVSFVGLFLRVVYIDPIVDSS